MPGKPSFGKLPDPAFTVDAPTAESPFRIAVLGDFSGRGQSGGKTEDVSSRKAYKVSRENIDDILALLKVQVKIPDLQGEAFEHTFATLEDFHPDQIHEKVDRFAFVSDEDDKAALMAALLHHPNFQAVESAWRGLDWLLRRAQKGGNQVEAVLYDITQEELAAALNAGDDLSASSLYKLLIEQAMQGPKGQPWALWLGLYDFDLKSADAQVLGRMAKIARHASVPFLAGTKSRLLEASFTPSEDEASAWSALRQLPEAALLGLALPRFLLRLPYGENTQSCERLSFEEFKTFAGKQDYLWGNAALACVALMAQSFLKDGWSFKPGSVLDLDSMMLHAYTQDDEEESVMAEAFLTKPTVEKLVKLGLMPILCAKGRNQMQLFRFLSLAQPPKNQPASDLQGRWGQAGLAGIARASAKPPMSVSTTFQMAQPASKSAGAAPPPSAPAPDPAAPAAPAPAATEAPAEEALDPELAALMAQFDTPAPAEAPAAEPAAEEPLDPELAALMAQFDTPAAPAAPAAEEPAAPAEEEALDPELAALMKQMEGGT